MTHEPDGDDADDCGHKLDEDAAWRSIVANFGERARLDPEPPPTAPDPGTGAGGTGAGGTGAGSAGQGAAADGTRAGWSDPAEAEESWEDEGHFVPPDPPPLPPLEPRRRLAWGCLFGAPVVMLLGVILGVAFPTWLTFLLVVGFVGGFVYLVAAMPHRGEDGDGPDDGAVV